MKKPHTDAYKQRRRKRRELRRAKLAHARLIGINLATIPANASIGKIQDFINQKEKS